MFKKNGLKRIVLQCVLEMSGATSKQISNRLGFYRVSDKKKVSMTLLKCWRQRLMEKTLLKRGRIREYSYVLTERGRRRIVFYASREGKSKFGLLNVDEMVKAARKDVNPLVMSALQSFHYAEYICSHTRQTHVFSKGTWCAILSLFPILLKPELISAFTAKYLLDAISPETSTAIENSTKELMDHDLSSIIENCNVIFGLLRLGNLSPPGFSYVDVHALRRIRELHEQQFFLYRNWRDEEYEKERYKRLYESSIS